MTEKVIAFREAFVACLTKSCLITTVDVIVFLQLAHSCGQIETEYIFIFVAIVKCFSGHS